VCGSWSGKNSDSPSIPNSCRSGVISPIQATGGGLARNFRMLGIVLKVGMPSCVGLSTLQMGEVANPLLPATLDVAKLKGRVTSMYPRKLP
jgi:hypothetical protein